MINTGDGVRREGEVIAEAMGDPLPAAARSILAADTYTMLGVRRGGLSLVSTGYIGAIWRDDRGPVDVGYDEATVAKAAAAMPAIADLAAGCGDGIAAAVVPKLGDGVVAWSSVDKFILCGACDGVGAGVLLSKGCTHCRATGGFAREVHGWCDGGGRLIGDAWSALDMHETGPFGVVEARESSLRWLWMHGARGVLVGPSRLRGHCWIAAEVPDEVCGRVVLAVVGRGKVQGGGV